LTVLVGQAGEGVGEVGVKRKDLPLDALSLEESVSGHLRLDFSRGVEWDEFPRFVRRLMKMCGGRVVERADAGDIRVWGVRIERVELDVAWDEQEWGEQGFLVSLASRDSAGDLIVSKLHTVLKDAESFRA
jgi:hypothetical protein